MRPILVPLLGVVLVAACSAAPAASSPAPTSSTVSTPSMPPSPSPSASPTVLPTPAPTPTPSPSPATSPTPGSTPSLPPIGAAPAGPWSTIHWYDTGALPLGPTEVGVFGWSGGYVAFEQSPGSDESGDDLPVVIRASASSDGAHWSAPTTLETGFKGMEQIRSIVEGPGGLLALGYPYGDTCGGPESLFALWSSSDGRSWKRLAMPKSFVDNQVQTISGGAAGYIAFGTKRDSTTAMIWTSVDGRTWTTRPLPTVASGTVVIDAAVSFDRGFVLAGAVLGPGECGGPAHIHGATWFSPDGAAWSRNDLPGASIDPPATFGILKLMGRLLVVEQPPTDSEWLRGWMSTDGRSWTSAAKVPQDLVWRSVTDGVHSVLPIPPAEGVGPSIWAGFDASATETELGTDGDQPVIAVDGPAWIYAVGPTGVLATLSDGSASRLGLPR